MPTDAVQQVQAIRSFEDLVTYLEEALGWPLEGAQFDEVTFEYTPAELGVPEADAARVRPIKQLRPLATNQPWGVFFVEFEHHRLPVTALRRILRALVTRKRQAPKRSALPTWALPELLFTTIHGDADRPQIAFTHFSGEQPQGAKLTTFGWSPDEPCRTICEYNLPALSWPEDTADAAAWSSQWASAFDVEKVTKHFYRDFEQLFRATKARITGLPDEATLHDFTQALFNRLLFITFIQKKRWLDDNPRYLFERFAQVNREGKNFYAEFLYYLFFVALPAEPEFRDFGAQSVVERRLGHVPFLNGGLFEVGPWDAPERVSIPNQAFADIFSRLLDHYNFTVTESTPLDIEVAVDPEMLGKVFEELVTGRHESGSYYTPKPVVAFMCREALKGYLAAALPDEPPEAIARFVDDREATRLRNPEAVLQALRTVRACDPACGSGAYLLGMMHELLELRACLFAARQLDAKTVYQRKVEIIRDNLYGVDIDPFAVNIARLRLWLSLVVDYEGDDPPPLPNLDYKIETGDSILGPNPQGPAQQAMQQELIRKYQRAKAEFMRSHGARKEELRSQVEEMRADIADWAHHGEEVQGFDWAVQFAEVFAAGGFDVALANPPYVRQELIGPTKPLLLQRYPEALSGKSDLYCAFYARALELLRPGGMHVFVCSNSWLDVGYGGKLQGYLLDRAHVRAIYDSAVERQFATADINTIISIIQKGRPDDHATTHFISLKAPFEQAIATPELRREITRTRDDLWRAGLGEPNRSGVRAYSGDKWGGKYLRAPDIYWRILEKAGDKLVRLGDIAEVRFGIKTGANEFFYLDRQKADEWGLEERFLRLAIKTPRDYYGIRIPGSQVLMFWCQENRSSLQDTQALRYIEWGEEQGFCDVPSCRSRSNWYSLRGPEHPVMLWPSAFFERHIVYECPECYVADKVFYTLSGDIPPSVRAFLNSTITSLFVEVEGYQLNHGGIFVTTDWLSNMPVLTAEDEHLASLYESVASRDILLCTDELRQPDRQALDCRILELLGLAPKETLGDLYDAVQEYVAGRITKARRATTKKGRGGQPFGADVDEDESA